MKVKDYYKILGVERTASTNEIRGAYHKLVRKYHPDMNPNGSFDMHKFTEINEAYQALGFVDNRVKYQQLLFRKDEKIDEIRKRRKKIREELKNEKS